LLQLCLALALWLLFWRSSTRTEVRKLLLAATLSYLGAACLLPLLAGLGFGETGILSRLQDTQLMCQSRLIMWRNVLHLIGLQPWFGWGWGVGGAVGTWGCYIGYGGGGLRCPDLCRRGFAQAKGPNAGLRVGLAAGGQRPEMQQLGLIGDFHQAIDRLALEP
jgi:hypothetical protein